MELGKWYYSRRVYAFPFFYYAKNGVGAFRYRVDKPNSLEFAALLKSMVEDEFELVGFDRVKDIPQDIIKAMFETSEKWRMDFGYMRHLRQHE
jgi:hypothetical protein